MAQSTAAIRTTFLEYFRSKEHKILSSSPLVPANDPTLMFTNAGMVQFKDVFIERRPRPAPRAATVQKCIRISGKHNDLENVGRTSRHHTFFEMLGNFSFGDYFKKDACRFGYDLLTDGYGIDSSRLWVTVFAGDEHARADEEAEAIWRDEIGIPKERIHRLGAKDNFWAMGDTGPCGPCSEIHFDRGEAFGPAELENGERFFELWNLVFMQYYVDEPGGPMKPLPKPCIDTGAGLERIASVLQHVDTNYETDALKPLVLRAAEISGKRCGENAEDDVSMRVIADHSRMAAMLIAEGIFPEKTGREYVLRRVMRRAIRHGHRLGIEALFFHKVVDGVVELMGGAYPELVDRRDLIDRICRQEEERFRATLGRGLELLRDTKEWTTGARGEKLLSGEVAFDLSATYGFPKDLIEVIGQEDGFGVDEEGYARAEERHKLVSGAGKIGDRAVASVYTELHNEHGDSRFVGYDAEQASTLVLALIKDGALANEAHEGELVEVVLAETPFYGEAGGQVGDHGEIAANDGTVQVTDTTRPTGGLWVHQSRVKKGRIRVGDEVRAVVDHERRTAVRRHHTATHLLHSALREVLGKHATQKGSLVGPDSLRFDFAHYEPLSAEQIAEIERRANSKALENHAVETRVMKYDEAKATGAMALFEENYGDVVRMVCVSEDSRELCGGTHVGRSGDIGAILVTSESGIAAGVRRIEATAGHRALAWLADKRQILGDCAELLRVAPNAAVRDRLQALLAENKELRRESDQLLRKLAAGNKDELLERIRLVGGVKVIGAQLSVGDPAALRETVDSLRQKIGSGVICLGGDNGGKAALVVAVTPDLAPVLDAGKLIRAVAAKVGGRGGGRPDLAQAGGPDVQNLDAAVEEIYLAVAEARKG